MKRALLGVAVLAATLVLVAGAGATTPTATNLTVTASFANAALADPSTPGAYMPVYCPPLGPGCTASPATQVRWGEAATGSGRSGLGFAPTPATSVPLDQNFVVGSLLHFNYAVYYAITSVDLAVHLTAHTADGDLTFDLPFTIGIDETQNATRLSDCPFSASPTDVPCPDMLTLPLGGVHAELPTGGLHPHTYTLTVVGFTTSPTGSSPTSSLITQENQTNTGYLVARLSRDNVAPVAADDPGNTTVSGGSTTIGVLANDSDADGDALTPTIATPPHGGTAAVNPDGTITYTADSGFAGTDTFTYAASDGLASSQPATVTVDVADMTKPTITVPAGGVSAAATGPSTPVTYTVTADDNVDGALTPSCDPPPGSMFPVGTTTVTCTVTDAAGNTGTETFDVTVTDTAPPSFNGVPSAQTVEATGPNGAAVTYSSPTASDLVDGAVAVACLPQSGSTFQLGGNTVSCTATDSHGNTATATFMVTVQDTTPPVLQLPADKTVYSSGGGSVAVAYTATATDLVDENVGVTCTPPSGSTFVVGPTTVNCEATDAAGNTAHGSFTVTVVPNRPPVCTDVRALGIGNLWPSNHKLVLITLTGATDPDAGTALTYTIVGVTQDEPITGGGSGNTAFDAQRASGGSVYLRSERAGTGDGRVYTIAFSVSDGSLSCTGTVDVAVPHDAAHDAVKSPHSYNSLG